MLITRLAEHAATRDLPPRFYRQRAVRWAILLDESGHCTTGRLEDLADATMPSGPQLPTPYMYRSGRNPAPMLIADTLHYVAALPKDDSAKAKQDARRRHLDYVALLREWRDTATGDPVAAAVQSFFEHGDHLTLALPEDARPADPAAIQVAGKWAHLSPSAKAFWEETVLGRKTTVGSEATCLACGQAGAMFDSIPEPVKAGAIPVASGRGRDSQLVSVNTQAQGRAGKLQLSATPICVECGRQAMAALNALLADDRHRRRASDSVLTWWLRDPEPVPFVSLLDHPDPAQVRELHESVHRTRSAGMIPLVQENRFYALTLGATQSRVVVRDWLDIPVPDLKQNLTAWFDDHRITDPWQGKRDLVPLRHLAHASGRWDQDTSRYVPGSAYYGIEHELLRCALRRTPPPASLLSHLLHRIRADNRVDLPRAALLKLILIRPPY